MPVVDGKPTAIRFNTFLVGNTTSIDFGAATTSEVAHNAFCDDRTRYQPGKTNDGTITVTFYRDVADGGQNQLHASREGRLVAPITLEYGDGETEEYEGFVSSITRPSSVTDVIVNTATIRIA